VTLVRAVTPEPVSPPTPGGSEHVTGSDIPVFPEVLDAVSCTWSRVGTLPSTRPPDAGEGSGWDIVEEWGLQSFPASDPPANW
jgi:hypothetical protein